MFGIRRYAMLGINTHPEHKPARTNLSWVYLSGADLREANMESTYTYLEHLLLRPSPIGA
jgi:hypothetical protein